MDGPSLINFSVAEVPKLVGDVLRAAGLTQDDIDSVHFASSHRQDAAQLMERLG